ncbi:MAG TPA: hypothetical protein VGR23_03650 [Candidatus Dormibacteraeota bacterium]|nr:hypothetical protein [Candidatus Dormibacteraeota bacterium]
MTRTACPIHGCPEIKAPDHLLCRIHWRRVPQRLRAAVWRAWKVRRTHPEDLAYLAAHREACWQAIAAIQPARGIEEVARL